MASPGLAFRNLGLFSDEVFTSTDLNRRSGEVLNHARKNPVTIARNNERFALIRREQAAGLIQALAHLREIVELCQGAVSAGVGIDPPPAMAWVTALNVEDRQTMLQEVLSESARASADDDWSAVGDLIHEWRESALVIESGVLRRAASEASDEQPLTDPAAEGDLEACA